MPVMPQAHVRKSAPSSAKSASGSTVDSTLRSAVPIVTDHWRTNGSRLRSADPNAQTRTGLLAFAAGLASRVVQPTARLVTSFVGIQLGDGGSQHDLAVAHEAVAVELRKHGAVAVEITLRNC